MWRRRRAKGPPTFAFDAWLEGLQRRVGDIQLDLGERLLPDLERRRAEADDVVLALPATGGNPAFTLTRAALRRPLVEALTTFELCFDAAVETGPDGRYRFVLEAAGAAAGARRVPLRVRLIGPQPGVGEVHVAGELLKRLDGPRAAGDGAYE